jgi:hypothetical protein
MIFIAEIAVGGLQTVDLVIIIILSHLASQQHANAGNVYLVLAGVGSLYR